MKKTKTQKKTTRTRRPKERGFKLGEAIVFEPQWWEEQSAKDQKAHPLTKGEIVYFMSEIPNVPGHCIVVKYSGIMVPMVHPGDFRIATDDEV